MNDYFSRRTAHDVQAVVDVPQVYGTLKTIATKCLSQIEFTEDAKKVFHSDRVQRQLKAVMRLIIEALELISHYYSKSFYSGFISVI